MNQELAVGEPRGESSERTALRDSVRAIVDRTSPAARIRELDEGEVFDEQLFKELARSGVLAIDSPTDPESGTVGDQLAVVEELAVGPTSMAAFMIAHYAAIRSIATFGTTDQATSIVKGLSDGTLKASFAMSEPAGGTDVARAMTTSARRDGADWILTGQKLWTSGAMIADWLVVLARSSPLTDRPIAGVSMFLVDRNAPGLVVRELDTLGIHGMSTCEIFLDDVRLPSDALLGEEGRAMHQVFETIDREGLHAAAACLGIARGALSAAVEYARTRSLFGRTIGSLQVPQHWLVDSAVSIELARLSLDHATEQYESGEPNDGRTALIAKLVASEAAVTIPLKGMQIMGGAGYSREHSMQRYFRDARLWSFSPLTNEMVRNRLGETMLGLGRSY